MSVSAEFNQEQQNDAAEAGDSDGETGEADVVVK
jgi:hypothetical protein